MTDPHDSLLGTLAAGRYRVLKLLGEGGMGQVYLAEHVAIEKRVALKVLRAQYATKGEIVTRFQQEAISASRIKHPNVLDVFDFGQLENGCFFLAMEFLEGNDLADELSRRGVLDAAAGIRISMQICRALAAAHANGVVHRDLKPENVFLQRTADGEEIVKIVDFGIAQLRSKDEAASAAPAKRRLTRTGMIFGTPEYMAPEQAGGKHADLRSDIYAVGIIMYEMFTGAVPFTGETFLGVLAKHLSDPAPPMNQVCPELTISASLQAAIMRALEKDPARRYQTMLEFAQAISATSDASVLGYRPSQPAPGAHPHPARAPALGIPTHQQFAPSTPPLAAPGRDAPRPRQEEQATAAARAETLLAAETQAESLAPRNKMGLSRWLGLAAVSAAAAGALWFIAKPSPLAVVASEPASATPSAPPKSSVVPVEPVAQLAGSATAAVEAVVAPASGIRLEVVTEPPGALLLKNGFQVCDSTPCDVLAAPAETLEFQASKGAWKGSAKVLAQRDQKVLIRMSTPSVKPASKRLCEVEVDGLKILRDCK